jgi:hypothetical protein
MEPDMTTGQPPHHTRSSILTKRAQTALFSGRMPRFSGTHPASFVPCVRRNLRHSQVWRVMFSRTYIYESQTNLIDEATGESWQPKESVG